MPLLFRIRDKLAVAVLSLGFLVHCRRNLIESVLVCFMVVDLSETLASHRLETRFAAKLS